jgi:hypothetical protein
MGGGTPVGTPAGLRPKLRRSIKPPFLIPSSAGNLREFRQTLPTRIPGTGSSPPAAT